MILSRAFTAVFSVALVTLLCSGGSVTNLSVISYGLIKEKAEFSSSYQFHGNSRASALLATAVEAPEDLIFVGDVMMARNVEYLMQEHGGQYPFAGIEFKNLSPSPYVVGNFEAAVPQTHTQTPVEQLQFSVATMYLSELKKAGFSHLSLANNHSYDFGAVGYRNTINELHAVGLNTFGNPRRLDETTVTYIKLRQQTIAVVGLQAIDVLADEKVLPTLFDDVKGKSDLQIVYIHWGNEYDSTSSAPQQNLAQKLVALGADLIVGHHPHVVQEVALIDNVPVFYSLGNYVFDQYFSDEVQEGLLLHLTFDQSAIIHVLPVETRHVLSQPNYMTPPNHQLFLKKLAQKSSPFLSSELLSGIIRLDRSFATSSKIAMMNR